MPKIIEAIYEDGVFKPLDQVPLPEHTKISLTLSPPKDWSEKFKRLLNKVHQRTKDIPPETIERDIGCRACLKLPI